MLEGPYAHCRLEELYERTLYGQHNLLRVIAVHRIHANSDRPLCCKWAEPHELYTKSCKLKKLGRMLDALATSCHTTNVPVGPEAGLQGVPPLRLF